VPAAGKSKSKRYSSWQGEQRSGTRTTIQPVRENKGRDADTLGPPGPERRLGPSAHGDTTRNADASVSCCPGKLAEDMCHAKLSQCATVRATTIAMEPEALATETPRLASSSSRSIRRSRPGASDPRLGHSSGVPRPGHSLRRKDSLVPFSTRDAEVLLHQNTLAPIRTGCSPMARPPSPLYRRSVFDLRVVVHDNGMTAL
jgi:hypothetical protein